MSRLTRATKGLTPSRRFDLYLIFFRLYLVCAASCLENAWASASKFPKALDIVTENKSSVSTGRWPRFATCRPEYPVGPKIPAKSGVRTTLVPDLGVSKCRDRNPNHKL
jgi:hypothetical protein